MAENRVILTFDLLRRNRRTLGRREVQRHRFSVEKYQNASRDRKAGFGLRASSSYLENGAVVVIEETRHRIQALAGWRGLSCSFRSAAGDSVY